MWRPGLLILTVVLLISPSVSAQTPTESEDIQAMLDEKSRAYERGDLEGFVSSVHSEAPEFLASQTAWFQRARTLPIVALSFRLRVDRYGELTRKRDKNRFGDSAMVAVVQRRYNFEGYSSVQWLDEVIWAFVQQGGRWRIASDSPLDDLGIYSDRQLWELSEVSMTASEHFVVVASPGDRAFASEILPVAESALIEIDRVWKGQWTRKVPIFVASNKSELERLLSATFDVENFVAFALNSVDAESDFETRSDRVVINRTNFVRHSAESRKTILAHELIHFATRRASGPFVPAWVEEGLAQLVETRGRPNTRIFDHRVSDGTFNGRVPDDLEFMTGGRESILAAYQASVSAFAYMLETNGIDKMNDFYTQLGAVRIEPGTSDYHVDSALRRSLGVSLGDFEAAWKGSLR